MKDGRIATEIALAGCPFCGSKEVNAYECMSEYWVRCMACEACSAMSSNKELAIRAWNTRNGVPAEST